MKTKGDSNWWLFPNKINNLKYGKN
jgi:hypothetical protein